MSTYHNIDDDISKVIENVTESVKKEITLLAEKEFRRQEQFNDIILGLPIVKNAIKKKEEEIAELKCVKSSSPKVSYDTADILNRISKLEAKLISLEVSKNIPSIPYSSVNSTNNFSKIETRMNIHFSEITSEIHTIKQNYVSLHSKLDEILLQLHKNIYTCNTSDSYNSSTCLTGLNTNEVKNIYLDISEKMVTPTISNNIIEQEYQCSPTKRCQNNTTGYKKELTPVEETEINIEKVIAKPFQNLTIDCSIPIERDVDEEEEEEEDEEEEEEEEEEVIEEKVVEVKHTIAENKEEEDEEEEDEEEEEEEEEKEEEEEEEEEEDEEEEDEVKEKEEEEEEEEVYEIEFDGKSYYTNDVDIYENNDDEVGNKIGKIVNGKPVFTK